jgi:hypothetical protein
MALKKRSRPVASQINDDAEVARLDRGQMTTDVYCLYSIRGYFYVFAGQIA